MPRGKQKYPFRSDDFSKFDDYDGSPEKITALVKYFTEKWSWPVDVPRYAVRAMAHRLKKTRTKEPYWTEKDVETLREDFGVIPDNRLCKKLGRTRVSIVLKAKRVKINRKMNIMTARSVAEICGIPDSHTVMMWVRKELLKAKKSGTYCGGTRMWNIDDGSLARMLKDNPWLAYLPDMPDSYYKRLVEREWEENPWFTRQEVANMLGVGPDYVPRYIKRGWLRGTKVPGGRHSQVRWMFRASWVMAFLNDDPRNKYHRKLLSMTKKGKNLLSGNHPVQLYGVWLIKCPRCERIVAVSAAANRRCKYAPGVKEAFLATLDGHCHCIHGSYVALEETNTSFKKPRKRVNGTPA